MSRSISIALLDACVLYPVPMQDLLLNLADYDLFIPKWTNQIQEEWTRNLLANRPDLTATQLSETVEAMNEAFPESNVEGYQRLIAPIVPPDPDGRHVLAAAVLCKADIIVTANLGDLPNEYLKEYGIEAQHPDYFIAELISKNQASGWPLLKTRYPF